MIAVVTGFIPIPEHPRPASEYRQLGERLLNAQVPQGDAILMAMEMKLTDCWLYQYLEWRGMEFTHSVSDNPRKNTPAYHIVQAQKCEFLVEAARSHSVADVFAWIDFGIFHLKGMTDQILIDFLRRARNEQSITIPGCWDKNYTYNDAHPCWRFAGGLWIVPRKFVIELDVMVKQEYISWIEKTNNLSWDVNCLSRLEKRWPKIWWYRADHDSSLFSNYQCGGTH